MVTQSSFRKILIANRGEIALRITKTCRAMGIATVAVYSDADANVPHVRFADEAVRLGAPPPRDSYLNIAQIIKAAKTSCADAIHPGYGFLSENAEFAEACAEAGITFIGPRPEVIRKMGLKSSARKLAAAAGAPVVPGYDGEDQSDEILREEILKIGFPVLIKASAGGGGKGMRVVRNEAEISNSIESARREAEKAFGNSALLLEKFIEHARHVEIQILSDEHGNLVHLFERDCSLQRRHQKIIEESPSPAVSDELRVKMCAAAVSIGKAIGYSNAGTVEFILSPNGEFYFIEVNTRLQVEHPVTEMITGLDLVKLQIEIAEGKSLPFVQTDLKTHGHAIEARVYAEDPNKDFLPATGKIHDWRLPDADGLRVDSGAETGMEVGIYYDPMLAKLIAHASDRQTAIRKLSYALRQASIQGLQTNREFLIRLLEHETFQSGETHTGFIAGNLDGLIGSADEQLERASAVAAALYLQQTRQSADSLLSKIPPNYRNNPFRNPSMKLKVGEREVEVSWRHLAGNRFEVQAIGIGVEVEVFAQNGGSIRLALDGMQREFRIVEAGDRLYVHSSLGSSVITRLPRHPIPQFASQEGTASSPMPGQVLKILVSEGQQVAAGDALLILEAMKMEQTIRAASDGIVEAIKVTPGQVVSPGDVLIQVRAS